jgi:hypothetical protein
MALAETGCVATLKDNTYQNVSVTKTKKKVPNKEMPP